MHNIDHKHLDVAVVTRDFPRRNVDYTTRPLTLMYWERDCYSKNALFRKASNLLHGLSVILIN